MASPRTIQIQGEFPPLLAAGLEAATAGLPDGVVSVWVGCALGLMEGRGDLVGRGDSEGVASEVSGGDDSGVSLGDALAVPSLGAGSWVALGNPDEREEIAPLTFSPPEHDPNQQVVAKAKAIRVSLPATGCERRSIQTEDATLFVTLYVHPTTNTKALISSPGCGMR
jgi:hypothetical protein